MENAYTQQLGLINPRPRFTFAKPFEPSFLEWLRKVSLYTDRPLNEAIADHAWSAFCMAWIAVAWAMLGGGNE